MHIKLERECSNCNLLRDLLEEERTNNRRLMDKIISLMNPMAATVQETVDSALKPITPKTWHERRRILEEEDRKRADLEKKKKEEIKAAKLDLSDEREKTIDELEKELGVEDVPA